MKPANIQYLKSAGGVIFKQKNNEIEVALIAIKNGKIWTLPKGLIDKGENAEEAAIREIAEETGLYGKIVNFIGEKSYWFYMKDANVKCKKTVLYYLLKCLNGDMKKHSWEVDEAKWFHIDEAILIASYRSDKDIIKKAKDYLLNTKLENI